MKVLVVGATGVMGREVVKQLIQEGNQVRAMTRAPQKADDLRSSGAEVVQGDLIDPASLARACEGMDAVISAAHSLLGTGKYKSEAVDLIGQKALVDAAKAAGVQYFVFTSVLGAALDSPLDFARHKAEVEQYVQGSGMSYTILRPPAFMEWHAHFFIGKDILEKGKVTIFGNGNNPCNFIAGRDAARFAVMALTNPRACNRVIEIGGLENVTKNRVAEMYVRLSGKPARIGHMPPQLLRVMSALIKPIKPEISRVMLFSYLGDTTDQTFDPTRLLKEFPVELMRLEEFVKSQVDVWKQ